MLETTQTSTTGEWMKKLWNHPVVEYYIGGIRNEFLECDKKLTNLENTKLSERSQIKKGHTS
jgi:hypothetical protein